MESHGSDPKPPGFSVTDMGTTESSVYAREPLPHDALDQLFLSARTRNAWRKQRLPEETWRKLYDILKFGPTSANCSPARFVFCVSDEAKARAVKHMSSTNAAKSFDASAIVIIGKDIDFAERLPLLFPHAPSAKYWFSDPEVQEETAFRNATLQGAYLILAARALGLDAGPISGFDQRGIDQEFFVGTSVRSNFICMLGIGADEPFARLPRLDFEQACRCI
jgi:3-hydroxypropanoate dehydrogenase